VPTLNELHRPFRVGNTATEANPLLAPETLRGAEFGFAYRRDRLEAALTAFTNSLRDAVGNVTLATTPTLVSRQRLNLDRVRVRGLEAHVAWSPQAAWRFEGGFVWSDARVQAANGQPALVGRRLAQVPRLTATASVTWRPTASWEAGADARWSSAQYEDDENLLPLGAAGTINVSVSRRFASRVSAMLRADNLLDAAVEASRSATAPTTYAAPRAVMLQVTVIW
jgi:outer membrane receptor protein involved in Fe transport